MLNNLPFNEFHHREVSATTNETYAIFGQTPVITKYFDGQYAYTSRPTLADVIEKPLSTNQQTILVNEMLILQETLVKPSKNSKTAGCRHCRFLTIIVTKNDLRISRSRACVHVNVETGLSSGMRTESKEEEICPKSAYKWNIDRAPYSELPWLPQ